MKEQKIMQDQKVTNWMFLIGYVFLTVIVAILWFGGIHQKTELKILPVGIKMIPQRETWVKFVGDNELLVEEKELPPTFELAGIELSVFTPHRRQPILKLPHDGKNPFYSTLRLDAGDKFYEWSFDGQRFNLKQVWMWTGKDWCTGK